MNESRDNPTMAVLVLISAVLLVAAWLVKRPVEKPRPQSVPSVMVYFP